MYAFPDFGQKPAIFADGFVWGVQDEDDEKHTLLYPDEPATTPKTIVHALPVNQRLTCVGFQPWYYEDRESFAVFLDQTYMHRRILIERFKSVYARVTDELLKALPQDEKVRWCEGARAKHVDTHEMLPSEIAERMGDAPDYIFFPHVSKIPILAEETAIHQRQEAITLTPEELAELKQFFEDQTLPGASFWGKVHVVIPMTQLA